MYDIFWNYTFVIQRASDFQLWKRSIIPHEHLTYSRVCVCVCVCTCLGGYCLSSLVGWRLHESKDLVSFATESLKPETGAGMQCLKSTCCPGQVLGYSLFCTRQGAGLIPRQGAYKNQPMNAKISLATDRFSLSPFLSLKINQFL